jgi:thioredoxin 1
MTNTVTNENYNTKVLGEVELPVFLKVGATWCNPCKMMNPIIAELETDLAGVVNVYTADTDDSPGLADDLGIESVPTYIMYRDGVKLAETSGVYPKVAMLDWISETLAEAADSVE